MHLDPDFKSLAYGDQGRRGAQIVAGEREAEDLAQDVGLFTPNVVHFPAWETLPFTGVGGRQGPSFDATRST